MCRLNITKAAVFLSQRSCKLENWNCFLHFVSIALFELSLLLCFFLKIFVRTSRTLSRCLLIREEDIPWMVTKHIVYWFVYGLDDYMPLANVYTHTLAYQPRYTGLGFCIFF